MLLDSLRSLDKLRPLLFSLELNPHSTDSFSREIPTLLHSGLHLANSRCTSKTLSGSWSSNRDIDAFDSGVLDTVIFDFELMFAVVDPPSCPWTKRVSLALKRVRIHRLTTFAEVRRDVHQSHDATGCIRCGHTIVLP